MEDVQTAKPEETETETTQETTQEISKPKMSQTTQSTKGKVIQKGHFFKNVNELEIFY